MGGAHAKYLNKKINNIAIKVISENAKKTSVTGNSTISLNISKSKEVKIRNNKFLNTATINVKSFLESLQNVSLGEEILEKVKNDTTIVDEGMASALSSNKAEFATNFEEKIKKEIQIITYDDLKNLIENKIQIEIVDSYQISFESNSLENSFEIVSEAIIKSSSIAEAITKLSSDMANSSSITVKNALAILVDSAANFLSAPLFAFLGILLSLGVLFLIFNKAIRDFLFGWIFKLFKKNKKTAK